MYVRYLSWGCRLTWMQQVVVRHSVSLQQIMYWMSQERIHASFDDVLNTAARRNKILGSSQKLLVLLQVIMHLLTGTQCDQYAGRRRGVLIKCHDVKQQICQLRSPAILSELVVLLMICKCTSRSLKIDAYSSMQQSCTAELKLRVLEYFNSNLLNDTHAVCPPTTTTIITKIRAHEDVRAFCSNVFIFRICCLYSRSI